MRDEIIVTSAKPKLYLKFCNLSLQQAVLFKKETDLMHYCILQFVSRENPRSYSAFTLSYFMQFKTLAEKLDKEMLILNKHIIISEAIGLS